MHKKELLQALEYNTKNAGEQLLKLSNDWNVHINNLEKREIIDTVRSIAIHLLEQWQKFEHLDEVNTKEINA
ncbi:hypothetical protein [Bacillus altitudinis]